MKTSLQLKIGQHLTMTPQLQQAIRLLQLSALDLQQEIQQALYSNPLLELSDEVERPGGDSEQNTEATETATADADSDGWDSDIPTELAMDTSWEDIYQSSGSGSQSSQNSGGDTPDFE